LVMPTKRRFLWFLAIWGAAVCIAGRLLALSENPILQTVTSPLILEFLAGFVGYYVYRRGRLHRKVGIALLVASLVWLAGIIIYNGIADGGDSVLIDNDPVRRVALYGTFSVLFLFGAMELERSGAIRYFRSLENIGDWSYSIYLSHIIVIEIVGRATYHFIGPTRYSILWIDLLALPGTLIAGKLSYTCLEVPLLRRLYSLKFPRRQEEVSG